MNAAVYARVSSEYQAEHGYSLETQVEECVKLAKALGATTIQKYVDDGYSGVYLERPALESLRDALQASMFDAVICYVPDRLARRLSHQLLLTEEIERSGASLHFVSVDFKDTPEGRLFFQMHGAFSEYEREKIRERTMRGRRGKLRSGKPINDSHVYGYDFDKAESVYTVNPAEAKIVQLIFRLYAVERIGGTEMVAARLTKDGIPSPAGKPYWQGTTVRRILSQPMYIGRYYSNKYASQKVGPHKKIQSIRPENEWIEMRCPAIVSEEIFSEAQYYIGNNRKYKKYDYPKGVCMLQGLIVCGRCGRRMSVRSSRDKRFYACGPRKRQDEERNKSCGARYARSEIVDAVFWDLLEKVCANPSSLESYVSNTEGINISPSGNKSEDIKARLEKIKDERNAVMGWFEKSFITQDDATKKLSKLKTEEDKLRSTLERMPKEKRGRSKSELEKICSAISSCEQDALSRRRVIQSIIESVEMERTDKRRHTDDYTLRIKIHFR